MKKNIWLVLLIGLAVSGITFFGAHRLFSQSSVMVDSTLTQSPRIQPEKTPTFIYSFSPQAQVNFCGELVPFSELDVFERFEREFLMNVNDRVQVLMYLKRAGRYFPYIEKKLKESNLPDDFKYLMVAESKMLDLRSPVGAAGFWQIMPATGKQYGMVINSVIDERYNLECSTEVAIKYLKDAYARFGNWTMVAASYNMGVYGASDEQAFQSKKNYYDLWLNYETSRYLFRIVAIKECMQNSFKYGFDSYTPYAPLEVNSVEVKKEIPNLALWASENGTSFKAIKALNPWIRSRTVPTAPSNRPFKILFPKNGTITESLTEKYSYSQALASESDLKQGFHLVRDGETLQSIANQCGLTIDEIKKINRLGEESELKVGQKLKITP